ncbi:MAG: valine--tRNA ligase, partial [Oscillospiraceae bacterium]|nr:valine--tRNA ligase [Oscillospiraceae bacterium]
MQGKYDFQKTEKEMQDLWESGGVFKFDPDKESGGEIYSIDTPPPTVSGSLHMGHLSSYTQAEIVARYHRMRGRNVFYPFGFDDNGLPTERLVEREEGIKAGSMPRSEFARKCLETTAKYEDEFKAFWKSLGFSADWSTEYRTIGPDVQAISQRLFLDLVRMGKAYEKESPVLWCVECGTSIAQAELDATDMEGTFCYVNFSVGGEPLEVATTRPELLYPCVCLFVNPEDGRYRHLIGGTANVPLYGHDIPIKADPRVGVDKGTGVVMCSTFGDSTDVEWYSDHGLPYVRAIEPDGRISPEVPLLGGLTVKAAKEEAIRLLGERGLLVKTEAITHTVGTHERCGRPIEIIPSRQWYIDILSGKEAFLKAGDEVRWYPASMKARYVAWVENLKWDWCISRQRFFGVPFPVWYCGGCGKPAFADPADLPVNPLEQAYVGACGCGCTEFIPESAVFDTWATSSVTPQINERLGLKLVPMGMRTHAHEIIRTWSFYTIVRSLYHTGGIPWKDLMICGFILARKGEKISKSKTNNDFDPKHLIATHSADVLRYWTAGAKLGTDTFFAVDDLGASKRFITKLWNAARFAISRLDGFTREERDIPYDSLMPIDRWILCRLREATGKAAAYLDEYELGPARHEADGLFWKDFCDNYIEIAKDRLYNPDEHGAEAHRSGRCALYAALLGILKLYAIYVPHVTEAIYRDFFMAFEGAPSLHVTEWAVGAEADAKVLAFGEKVKEAVYAVRKDKSERNVSIKTGMDTLTVDSGS